MLSVPDKVASNMMLRVLAPASTRLAHHPEVAPELPIGTGLSLAGSVLTGQSELMPDRFIEQARAAFEPLAEAAGLEFVGQSDEEWFAWVKWSRGGITLSVSDDRRDRLIEVVIRRPMTDDDDRAALSQLMRGPELALPLWAVVESRGGVTDYDVSGDRRLERLPMYAEAVQTYGMEFLADPRTSVDAVVRVVRERNWEWSEEGRKAKRFLP